MDENDFKPFIPNPLRRPSDFCTEVVVTIKSFLYVILLAIYRFFIPKEKKSVSEEIVLVTGSGNGLGRSLAIQFSNLGATLVLWDINKVANEETAQLIRALGGNCRTYTCDISKRQEVYNTARAVKQDVGDVTILINNAGIVNGKSILESPDNMIEKTMHVNLLSLFWTVKSFLPYMIRKNHGHIVNIASSAGLAGISKLGDYSSSKFGVIGFTEVLKYEMAFSGYTGIHTTIVCPAMINTGMFQGAKMRNQAKFERLMPTLEVDDTVRTIIDGILTNQTMICIPRMVYLFAVLKAILPAEAMMELVQLFGADVFMDTFTGRRFSRKMSTIIDAVGVRRLSRRMSSIFDKVGGRRFSRRMSSMLASARSGNFPRKMSTVFDTMTSRNIQSKRMSVMRDGGSFPTSIKEEEILEE